MSAAHTPGPWSLDTVKTSCGLCHRIGPFPPKRDGEKPSHACVYVDYPSPGSPHAVQMEANARLIAAAPELLEALRTTASMLGTCRLIVVDKEARDQMTEQIRAVEALIDKANGSTT